jgi:DNA-binding transcriptional MerR regulator
MTRPTNRHTPHRLRDTLEHNDTQMIFLGGDVAVKYDVRRTYTLVEVASKVGRPRTTLKEWVNLFRDYIPTVGSGRTMRYEEDAIEVFSLIARMKDANAPNEIIREVLDGTVKEVAATKMLDEPGPIATQSPTVTSTRIEEQYDELMAQLRSQRDDIRRQQEDVVARLTELVRDLISTNQEQLEAMRRELSELKQRNLELVEWFKQEIERRDEAMMKDVAARDRILMETLRSIQDLKETQQKRHRWAWRG